MQGLQLYLHHDFMNEMFEYANIDQIWFFRVAMRQNIQGFLLKYSRKLQMS